MTTGRESLLGWHVISGDQLLCSLRRAAAGEDADLVFAELWANAEHEAFDDDPLPHSVRRMLQALDAYWLGYEGLPNGRRPRGRYTSEDWWNRFEGYREEVEAALDG